MASLHDLRLASVFASQFGQLSLELVPDRVAADSGDLWVLQGCRSRLGELSGRLRHPLSPLARPMTGDWVAVRDGGAPKWCVSERGASAENE